MARLPNGSEHRWGERVRVNIPVLVLTDALTAMDGCLKNLSLSGALVQSDCDFQRHTLIDVRIDSPPPTVRVSVVRAYVSRRLTHGIGIEWCDFAPPVVKALLRSPSVRFPP